MADVRGWRTAQNYRLWHGRAVFHYLTTPEDRAAHLQTLETAVEEDGWVGYWHLRGRRT